MHTPSPRGFTLIELLVVIAIICIMSAVVLAALNVARNRANDTKRMAEVNQLVKAIGNYYNDRGSLPRNSSGWCTYISNPTNGYGAAFASDIVPAYISRLPMDPVYGTQAGNYFYANENNNSGKFTVCAVLSQSTGQSYDATFGSCAGWSSSYNYCVSQ
ncbi:MAG TPA: type II secretion system protein [Candidatus Paceibacterota bacterium]|nr:type II secretion system protein [Candidatus Paceibacterota bacterium]